MRADAESLPKKSLNEEAFEQIKHDIVWCKLSPGEEVSEARLTGLYGFGKASIRRALSQLAQEGYVIPIPRSGHLITPVTLQSVKEVFELRMLIEPVVMEKACGHVDAARLQALNAECAVGYVPGDTVSEGRFVAANRAFHMEIANCSGNSRMANSLSQIIDEMTRLLHLGFVLRERPEELHQEHDTLIEALSSGDKPRARAITEAHINTIRTLVVEGIIKHTNLSGTSISRAKA
ncbi:transcriptional regulator, GntR family [Beijerinckia sp. 28-YEA-48]|nr:transcriptional regulator, GntR family [Beijerinckia sp. 28-YEA-48]